MANSEAAGFASGMASSLPQLMQMLMQNKQMQQQAQHQNADTITSGLENQSHLAQLQTKMIQDRAIADQNNYRETVQATGRTPAALQTPAGLSSWQNVLDASKTHDGNSSNEQNAVLRSLDVQESKASAAMNAISNRIANGTQLQTDIGDISDLKQQISNIRNQRSRMDIYKNNIPELVNPVRTSPLENISMVQPGQTSPAPLTQQPIVDARTQKLRSLFGQ